MFKDETIQMSHLSKWLNWHLKWAAVLCCHPTTWENAGDSDNRSSIHTTQNLNHSGICAWVHVLHVRLLMASAETAKCLTRSQKTKLWVRGSVIISSQLPSRGRDEIREEDGEVEEEYQMMGAMEVNYCKWKVSLKQCEDLGWVSALFIHCTICLRTIKHPSEPFCLPRRPQITLQFLQFVP